MNRKNKTIIIIGLGAIGVTLLFLRLLFSEHILFYLGWFFIAAQVLFTIYSTLTNKDGKD
jgi:hypothetical protein